MISNLASDQGIGDEVDGGESKDTVQNTAFTDSLRVLASCVARKEEADEAKT